MKKKFWLLFALVAFLSIAFVPQLDAQVRENRRTQQDEDIDDLFDESKGFKHRLWYGGGFSLGFTGNSLESFFQFGITPMVGYKITENFSIGPRATLLYIYYGFDFGNRVDRNHEIEWGIGAFARYKVFRNFFAHAEYELYSDVRFLIDGSGQGDIIPARVERGNSFIGAGYNSGGRIGYEIMLLYNLTLAENDPSSPILFRGGFTYKF
ncbi:MAG: hypothetical protein AAF798_14310 [Bacteroidota bacterium]